MTKKHIINQTIFSYVAAEVSEGQWLLNNYKEKIEYILEDTTIEIDNITYIYSSKEIPQTIFKILSRRINIPFTTELFEFI